MERIRLIGNSDPREDYGQEIGVINDRQSAVRPCYNGSRNAVSDALSVCKIASPFIQPK